MLDLTDVGVLGHPLTDAADWNVKFDLYEINGYGCLPSIGLRDNIPTTDNCGEQCIQYQIWARYDQGRIHMDLAGEGIDYDDWGAYYPQKGWYTVGFDWNATTRTISYSIDGNPVWSSVKGSGVSFSLTHFGIWDHVGSSSAEGSQQYIDNLVISE